MGDLIANWIFVAFVGAVITSFSAPVEEDFNRSTGHFFAWMFLPIIFPILSLVALIKWKNLFTPLYHYLFKVEVDDNNDVKR